ncbi:MAG: MarR family transcriptional regulator [Nitrosopumilales archaeon]|nr:MAG: MarR family transcriptional regulator [Nitrosopumilales archaeon]
MMKNTARDTASFYNAILHSLADEQIMTIINCTRDTAKSMNDIITETQISRTTVHRKINSMVKNGLIVVEKFMIASDGKKSKLFRSKLSGIKIKYEDNNMFVIVEENPKVTAITGIRNHVENIFALDKLDDDTDYLLVK